MQFSNKSFVVVVGPSGSGKTTLLSAIIGELKRCEGVFLSSAESIGYAAQVPYLMQDSIRNNILFSRKYNSPAYKSVMRACALTKEVQRFSAADLTEVESRGFSLSGGQRARISLARAIYGAALSIHGETCEKDEEIFVLDDPLSSLDPLTLHTVWRRVFQTGGILDGRSIVLATHCLGPFLADPRISKIIVMVEGKIVAEGSLEDLGFFLPTLKRLIGPPHAVHDDTMINEDTLIKPDNNDNNSNNDDDNNNTKYKYSEINDNLVAPEYRSQGSIGRHVWFWYLKAARPFLLLFVLFACGIGASTNNFCDYWVKLWTSNEAPPGGFYYSYFSSRGMTNLYFILIYVLVVLTSTFWSLLTTFGFAACGLEASIVAHESILRSTVQATREWFDTTPIGRIVNRLSDDVFTLDESIPASLQFVAIAAVTLSAKMTILAVNMPRLFLFLPLIGVFFISTCYWFRCSIRELKRLENISKSPIYEILSEALAGGQTIRAFRKSRTYQKRLLKHLERYQQISYTSCSVHGWLTIRLQLIGAAVQASMVACAIAPPFIGTQIVTADFAAILGLGLYTTMPLVRLLSALITGLIGAEIHMVSAERVKEYSCLPSEPFDQIEPKKVKLMGSVSQPILTNKSSLSFSRNKRNHDSLVRPHNLENLKLFPAVWPSAGALEFRDVFAEYRRGLPPALRNVSFKVNAGERVALVGRSGAGKSSICMALSRLMDYTGTIRIDGIDIQRVPPNVLRSRIAFVPQQPFIFSGTVRSNLDPFNHYTDDILWNALENCQLRAVIEALPRGLETPILPDESAIRVSDRNSRRPQGGVQGKRVPEDTMGVDLSVGQKQLLCFCRGFLRRSALMVLDEANSLVDADIERALLQQTLFGQSRMATVVFVTHRLGTVIDYCDRVLVFDRSEVVEMGDPLELLKHPGSKFSALRNHSREFD